MTSNGSRIEECTVCLHGIRIEGTEERVAYDEQLRHIVQGTARALI
jgi:hypothetical protein